MSVRQVAEDSESRLYVSRTHLSVHRPRASEVDMCGRIRRRRLIDATRKTAHGVVYLLISLVTRIGI
jgi:hypothetical protein